MQIILTILIVLTSIIIIGRSFYCEIFSTRRRSSCGHCLNNQSCSTANSKAENLTQNSDRISLPLLQ